MQLEVDSIVEGKITSITKFGAFVSLPSEKSGLVHISEVADTYVNDINEHLTLGQPVSVKIIGIAPDGKISLSIKKANAQSRPAYKSARPASGSAPRMERSARPAPRRNDAAVKSAAPASFEDKLKQFMQDSDTRMGESKLYAQQKRGSRRRKD